MYSQEEKDKMAMKNSTIDKFAAKQGCPPGKVPDGKGGCVYPIYGMQKGKSGLQRIGKTNDPNLSDSSYQANTGYKAEYDKDFGVIYRKPKNREELLKNKEDAKAGKYAKRNQ